MEMSECVYCGRLMPVDRVSFSTREGKIKIRKAYSVHWADSQRLDVCRGSRVFLDEKPSEMRVAA